jgi:hypothetical protein
MGNCMSAIGEHLEKQISDLYAGQTELEERLDKQQKKSPLLWNNGPETFGKNSKPK